MTTPTTDSDRKQVFATVARLAIAADGDTVYRDVYLQRASEMLSPIVGAEQYRGAVGNRELLDRLLGQARAAVTREDWVQVREIGGRASSIQHTLEAEKDTLAVAETVFGAPMLVLDPMSPGLGGSKRWTDPARARADLDETLAKLEADDAANRALYAARRTSLQDIALPAPPAVAAVATKTTGASPQQQALAALERGDASGLAGLADAMLGRAAERTATPGGAPTALGSIVAPPILGEPFPAESLPRAEALGLEAAVAVASPALAAEINAFMTRYALGASPAVHDRARDGVAQLSVAAERLDIPAELATTFADTVSLFALHLYVNSAGVRYVPVPAAREAVLVERHPDGDEAVTPLLEALGLDRRRGLSRDEIERGLHERGARVLAERLGLDPLAFRIVCIPPDLFMRLGGSRGWGHREEWTHFDGYQVLKGGRLRALVGGNARFGGLFDLCSISRDDARENTVVRFAVVRRERLAVRLSS